MAATRITAVRLRRNGLKRVAGDWEKRHGVCVVQRVTWAWYAAVAPVAATMQTDNIQCQA